MIVDWAVSLNDESCAFQNPNFDVIKFSM